MAQLKASVTLQWCFSVQTSYLDLVQQHPLLDEEEQCGVMALNWHNAFVFPREDNNVFRDRLTFHPVIDNFLRLLGGALGEPVVTEQRCDLIGVHQLPRHEGQVAKRYLCYSTVDKKLENGRETIEIKQMAECGQKRRNKTFSHGSKNIYCSGSASAKLRISTTGKWLTCHLQQEFILKLTHNAQSCMTECVFSFLCILNKVTMMSYDSWSGRVWRRSFRAS